MKRKDLNTVKRSRLRSWFKNCWNAGMKSISFQAVRNGSGYVRPAYSFSEPTEAGRPSARGMLLAGALLALTTTFICLMLLSR